jgi:hypothetical protein
MLIGHALADNRIEKGTVEKVNFVLRTNPKINHRGGLKQYTIVSGS